MGSRGVGLAESGGRGRVEGLLAQLLIWYSRLVRKGDLGTSDTHTYTPTRTHSVEMLLNCVSVSSCWRVKDKSVADFAAFMLLCDLL